MISILIFSVILFSVKLCQGLTFSGNIAAVFTPLDDEGFLNLPVIQQYARFLANNGVTGVFIGGEAGKGVNFNNEERKAVISAWVEYGKPLGLQIIAQIGGGPFYDVSNRAQFCESIGVDAIATIAEAFSQPKTAEKLVSDMKMVSDAAPSTPIMFYNHYTPPDVDTAEFFRLALSIPQFIGIKVSIEKALRIAAYNPHRNGAAILVSNFISTRAAFELGFNATISIAGSIFPRLANEIARAIAVSDISAAEEAQARLASLMTPIYGLQSKAAMEIVTGLRMGPLRAPLIDTTYEKKRTLTSLLEQRGLQLRSPVY